MLAGFNTLILGVGAGGPDAIVLLRLPLGIQITWQNLIESLGVICRMLSGAFMAIPLTFTIPPTRFGVAFRGLGLNDRIAFAVDLAIRLVPTYADDFRTTIDAQRAQVTHSRRREGRAQQHHNLGARVEPVDRCRQG